MNETQNLQFLIYFHILKGIHRSQFCCTNQVPYYVKNTYIEYYCYIICQCITINKRKWIYSNIWQPLYLTSVF